MVFSFYCVWKKNSISSCSLSRVSNATYAYCLAVECPFMLHLFFSTWAKAIFHSKYDFFSFFFIPFFTCTPAQMHSSQIRLSKSRISTSSLTQKPQPNNNNNQFIVKITFTFLKYAFCKYIFKFGFCADFHKASVLHLHFYRAKLIHFVSAFIVCRKLTFVK